MTDSERQWAKDHGIKKTSLKTSHGLKHSRIIYQDRDGKLYYLDGGTYHLTYREYCYEA